MGAGHGTNVPGYLLLPWTMLLGAAQIGNMILLLTALAQYPFYAVFIRYNPLLALPIVAAHFIAALWLVARNGGLF